ncbi:S-4TM family putative pore-forming effector [Microbacterium sp. RD1]|uniref:S-4TM family putative pore-forming effector n=1 Tax=Microbacterium sp. RD1 TaxID=3457313 RepID=UPI003FA5DF57
MSQDYTPPSSASIATRQNDDEALRLLLAQRRLYTRAKRWQAARWIGLLILGVAAPFISILIPGSAVAVGAITGIWLFVGRTFLTAAEVRTMTKAAAVQEEVDLYIFQMPETIERASRPTVEEIELLVRDKQGLHAAASHERLVHWYDIDPSHPGSETIAIAQRANASYTDRLIRTAVTVWAIVTVVWLAVLLTWSALSGLAFGLILLGVLFPVLPAVMDVADYLRSTWRAAQDRADLARTIESRLEDGEPIMGQELISWQTQLYDLRRTTPQVPDWLYKITRNRNEAAMHAASKRLRRKNQ